MRRTVAIAPLAVLCIALIVLHSDVKDFLWTHPWWHSFLVLIPTIAVPILTLMDVAHTKEVSEEANRLRAEANDLRVQQAKDVARIAGLQGELNKLQDERNALLAKIAANTARPLTEADANAAILRKYIGRLAWVTEGDGDWGREGAIIVEISDNNIVTLFVPAGQLGTYAEAMAQRVRCDRLQVVEERFGSCPVQISVIERYGHPSLYGGAKTWDERNVGSGTV